MVAVYLASSSGSSDWLGLVVALAIAGGAAGLLGSKARKTLLVLLVVGLLAYATAAFAGPYGPFCDPLYRFLGWC